jgi:hypothetical protein
MGEREFRESHLILIVEFSVSYPIQSTKQKSKRTSPALNWRSVKGLMVEPEVEVVASTNASPNTSAATAPPSTKSAPTDTRTAASEAGLVALNTIETTDSPSGPSFPAIGATTIDSHYDGVDITLPFFKDLLSDKPVAGANAIGSLATWSERVAASTDKGKKSGRSTTWEGEVDTLEF